MIKDLKKFYAANKRSHLPWRKTRDPYKILVSEIMLQQTQVDRVIPYYKNFLKQFPSAKILAKAPLSKVLSLWQGLGYNRRAKYLQEAAKILAKETYVGQKLPGVGPYTAGALSAFALNKPAAMIETNIRTVLFHHAPDSRRMTDAQLLPLVEKLLIDSKMEPKEFYWAMMDYGSHLKKKGIRLNSRSVHYKKQSKFEGSARQLRGAILRQLLKQPATLIQLTKNLSRSAGEVERELKRLNKDGLIEGKTRFVICR